MRESKRFPQLKPCTGRRVPVRTRVSSKIRCGEVKTAWYRGATHLESFQRVPFPRRPSILIPDALSWTPLSLQTAPLCGTRPTCTSFVAVMPARLFLSLHRAPPMVESDLKDPDPEWVKVTDSLSFKYQPG